MSQENVEAAGGVRTAVTVASKTRRRSLDERMLVRFPALRRAVISMWSQLSPRSRLRRALISRVVRQAYEAANRRDFEVVVSFLDPQIEFHFHESPAARFLPPDLLGTHHGHEGYRRAWQVGLEGWEYNIYCEEVIDFGDRLLTVGRQTGHGRSGGVSVDLPLVQVFTLRRGLPIRQVAFTDRDEAFSALGVPE